MALSQAWIRSGTTAVAAAEKTDRNANKIMVAACDVFLAAESCIIIPLFRCFRDAVRHLRKAMLSEAASVPWKVTTVIYAKRRFAKMIALPDELTETPDEGRRTLLWTF
jgi:hypothetical protein